MIKPPLMQCHSFVNSLIRQYPWFCYTSYMENLEQYRLLGWNKGGPPSQMSINNTIKSWYKLNFFCWSVSFHESIRCSLLNLSIFGSQIWWYAPLIWQWQQKIAFLSPGQPLLSLVHICFESLFSRYNQCLINMVVFDGFGPFEIPIFLEFLGPTTNPTGYENPQLKENHYKFSNIKISHFVRKLGLKIPQPYKSFVRIRNEYPQLKGKHYKSLNVRIPHLLQNLI